MHIRRLLAVAALFAVHIFAAGAARAAEMVLFDNPGLAGRQLTVRGYTPDVAATGFNDRASSASVRSGNWEVCTDADFRGFCAILTPGDYRVLDARFNDRILSAREAGATVLDTGSGRPNYLPRGAIDVFGQPGFRGRTMRLDRDAPDLTGTGFNDRASSLIVVEGTWELCTESGFTGACRLYAPGRYPDLGYGMDKQISSVRQVRSRAEPPVAAGGPGAPPPTSPPRLILFDNDNLRGRSIAISDGIADLQRAAFNDAAASMVIEGGAWEVCTDAYFRGECRVMGPGQYRRLDPALYHTISSARAAPLPPVATPPVVQRERRPGPDIELFDVSNFGGRRFATERDVADLEVRGFNDMARSMIINDGEWELCSDGGFKGRCTVFGPGRYANLRELNDQISSLRRMH